MKHSYLRSTFVAFVLLLFSAGHAAAQQSAWFDTETSWTYHFQLAFDFPNDSYQANYAITEQTEYAGRACAKMEYVGGSELPFGSEYDNAFRCMAVQPPYYFYTSGDSVFYASENDGQFHLAYDMGAEPGDTWEFVVPVTQEDVPGVFVDTFVAEVTDASEIFVDGQTLRRLTITYTYAGEGDAHTTLQGDNTYTVVENLGATEGFFVPFGQWMVASSCDGEFGVVLQCYTSETLEYLNDDFASCTLGLDGELEKAGLEMFPNPAATHTVITTEGLIGEKIEVLDVRGRQLSSATVHGPQTELDVSSLAPGVYLVRVGGTDGPGAKLKVMR